MREESKRIQLDDLRARLREAEETLEAIRSGAVDALVVSGPEGERIFTLKGAEQPYRLLVESMHEGAVSLRPEGEILYANTAFARIVGLDLNQVIGRNLIDFAVRGGDDAISNLITRAGRLAVRAELALASKSSESEVPVQLSLNPVRIDDSDFISVVVTDLSERRRSERAREAVKLRDEFIALAAHELRNPLTTLSYSVAALEKLAGNPNPVTLQPIVRKVRKQADRMTELINRMLDVSRLANGQLDLDFDSHDLGLIVLELVDLLSEEASQAKCLIDTCIEDDLKVQCDRLKLEQAIVNVISNAIKYGSGKPITVKARRDQNNAIVEVDDNGVGITEKDAERIFDRFERGNRSAGSTGLGLGLYVTRQIVKQHGGSIFAQSRTTGGSRFTISLPLDNRIASELMRKTC